MTARLALGLVIAAAAITYAARLDAPSWQLGAGAPRYLFDESYTAFTAHRLLLGDATVFEPAARRFAYLAAGTADLSARSRGEWSHPPGAPLAVAATMAVLGFDELGARAAPLCAALIALIATAWLTRRDAWLACALVACDGAFFVFARTAMPHMFMVAGLTAGAALVVAAATSPWRWRLACAAGAAFGFAAAVRWTAIPIACAIGGAALISRDGARLARPLVAALGVAAAVYLATYLPWLAHGHGLGDLVALHRKMLAFHAAMPGELAHGQPWYAWPFSRRPVTFLVGRDGDGVRAVRCLGGPILWWGLVPALVAGAWRARHRELRAVIAPCAIAATWLPWAVLGRFGLSYYLLPALPFVAVVVVDVIPRRAAIIALGLALAWFVISYPQLAAVAVR